NTPARTTRRTVAAARSAALRSMARGVSCGRSCSLPAATKNGANEHECPHQNEPGSHAADESSIRAEEKVPCNPHQEHAESEKRKHDQDSPRPRAHAGHSTRGETGEGMANVRSAPAYCSDSRIGSWHLFRSSPAPVEFGVSVTATVASTFP